MNLKNNLSPLPITKAYIIFDLHGVLVSKQTMAKKYDEKVIAFLEKQFGIPKVKAELAVQEANQKWIRFWDKAKVLPAERILENYEQANAVWAHTLVNDSFKGDYRQLAEFLEYTVPSQLCCLFPEVQAELDLLQKQRATLILASSAHTRHTFGILAGCKLLSYFHKIIGLENTLAVKSDLRYYQRLLQIIGAKAQDCLFIGNSTDEIALSKKVGMRVVFITRELTQDSLINTSNIAPQADLVLPTLENLVEHLYESHLLE